jgi:Zn-dependent protease with chaperone function
MKKAYCAILALLLSLFILIPLASAQGGPETPGRDPALEQKIYERLAQINPDAVPIFQEATQAMDSGDWTVARQGYQQVLEMAPGFPDAARRLSYVELALEDVESALQHAQQAYTVDPSPHNQSALARALLATEDPDKFADALAHAKAAAEALPEDIYTQTVLLWAGTMNEDLETLRQASTRLIEIAPDYALGHFYAGLIAADDGKWVKAESELLLSQELGMPPEDVQRVLAQGITSQARIQRWLRRGGYILAGWGAGLAVLFLVGILLSSLTLRTVSRRRPTAQFAIGRGELWVRTVYRVVIAITSLYFYLSIPLLILVVVAAAGGIFYLFLLIGHIPLRLAVFIGAAALVTLYAIVRSLFARVKEADPGRPLSREEAPALWSLAEEVAQRLGTRPVDAIYVTPSPEIAVLERGGIWTKLRGEGRRSLVLGLGALPGLSQSQFKAILAHEYGHFSNRDTAGGNLANQVRHSMYHMALGLALNGLARWYNPAWIFLNGFNRIFLRITLGASRLQEILADRYAVMAYGVQAFSEGLMHMIRQDLAFGMQVSDEVEQAQEQGRSLYNVYMLPPLESHGQQKELEEKTAEVMRRPASPYDSHPVPRERIALLEQLQLRTPSEVNPAPVWDLLPNAPALQAEMTEVIQTNLRRRQAMG